MLEVVQLGLGFGELPEEVWVPGWVGLGVDGTLEGLDSAALTMDVLRSRGIDLRRHEEDLGSEFIRGAWDSVSAGRT
jgi:hypothetical protein